MLFAPLRGLLALLEQVAVAVAQEQEAEEEAIKAELRELYRQLEAGQISEEEFDAQEAALLDRLDTLTADSEDDDSEDDEDDEDDSEDEDEGSDAP